MEPRSPRRRAADVALVLAFGAVLLAPAVDQVVRPADARNALVEYRSPAPNPGWPASLSELSAFPAAFGRFYEDQFGLRDRFLFLHSFVKWFGLGTSPTPKIARGEDDWIFVTGWEDLENHRGAMPMSRGLLEAWRRTLERRRDWLASHGIEYLFVVSPSKCEVYPERLDDRYAPLGPPRLAQLLEHLAETSDVRVLDLRPAVEAARAADAPGDHAYYPLGNHWTDRGAYAGYVEVVRRLAEVLPDLEPLRPEDFEVKRLAHPGDSWAGRLYLGDLLHQQNLQWRVRRPTARMLEGAPQGPYYAARRRDPEGPRAFLYHDSFALPMRPWLAEHFARIDCFWRTQIDPERILSERPDVVIQAYNELGVLWATPHLTPEEDAGLTRSRFEGAQRTLWRLDPRHPGWGLATSEGRKLAEEDGAAVFEKRSPHERLLLPEVAVSPGANLLLRLVVDGPAEGIVSLGTTTLHFPELDQRRSVVLPLAAGANELYAELPAEAFSSGPVLFFSGPGGRFVLREAELRERREEGAGE